MSRNERQYTSAPAAAAEAQAAAEEVAPAVEAEAAAAAAAEVLHSNSDKRGCRKSKDFAAAFGLE